MSALTWPVASIADDMMVCIRRRQDQETEIGGDGIDTHIEIVRRRQQEIGTTREEEE